MKKLLANLNGRLAKPHDFRLFLKNHKTKLLWIDNSNFDRDKCEDIAKFNEWKKGFEGNKDDVQAKQEYFIKNVNLDECFKHVQKFENYISPKNLVKLIQTASKNPKCHRIEGPKQEVRYLPEIRAALKENRFQQDPACAWIYKR